MSQSSMTALRVIRGSRPLFSPATTAKSSAAPPTPPPVLLPRQLNLRRRPPRLQDLVLHNLQNPTNKKEIHCYEKLKSIFDGKELLTLLSRMVTQLLF
ncbi:hypothetical protein MLD38_023760 [Melastoma candidum]|uniref:Uncharacterized protein n=1 Tax=Melastoma candidum TaxID=119954 RepID=A0ACB9NQB5_9MYRT|nr:hypothetical protein MLD38_023760 [Melastoma candidum]